MRPFAHLLPIAAASVVALVPASAAAADTSPGIAQAVGLRASPLAGGNTLTLKVYGNLDGTSRLYFGDQPGTSQIVTPNNLVCIPEFPCDGGTDGWLVQAVVPPAASPGKVELTVRTGDAVLGGQTPEIDDYVYYVEPTITSVTPASGPVAGGNRVEIRVEGLLIKDPAVTVGGVAATGVESTQTGGGPGSAQQLITATVPAGAAAGTVDVQVRGIVDRGVPQWGTASGVTAIADDYTYTAVAPTGPKVTSLSGGPALAGIGGIIGIRGTGLGGLKSVKVGTRAATTLSASSTQIYVLAPALAKGSYPVTVTTKTGTATAPTKLVYRSLF